MQYHKDKGQDSASVYMVYQNYLNKFVVKENMAIDLYRTSDLSMPVCAVYGLNI